MTRSCLKASAIALSALLSGLAATSSAHGADICEAVALYDIPSLENPQSILKRGEIDSAVTQWRVSKRDGASSICSHGGYCYPTSVKIDGRMVDALILLNCRVGRLDPDASDDEFKTYAVDVIRSRVAPKELAEDDADNRLLEAGLCTVCAGNAAHAYVYAPHSPCAKAVADALTGNRSAIAKLKDDSSICEK